MRIMPIFFLLISASVLASDQKYSVDLFCQDLNVILQKVNVYSMNISNHKTTRTAEGGYFKRKLVKNCVNGKCEIVTDESSPILVYQPSHPDAQETGYVAYPSFSIADEKAKLIKAQNAYDLVVGNMPVKPVDLLIGDKFEKCFADYKFFKEQFDFQSYLGRK